MQNYFDSALVSDPKERTFKALQEMKVKVL
jgi:hypothetical protein